MLFYSFFKTLVGQTVVVELKNDLCLRGKLHSVDQFLNIKLNDITVLEEQNYPHMASVKHCFVRGSSVRYVHVPKDINVEALQDAARREAVNQKEAPAAPAPKPAAAKA